MNNITNASPSTAESEPAFIESIPKDGPTVLSSIIFTGAGSAPAFSTIARSLASFILSKPVIRALPFAILTRNEGARKTLLSKIIAKRLPIFAPVTRLKTRAPSSFNVSETSYLPID